MIYIPAKIKRNVMWRESEFSLNLFCQSFTCWSWPDSVALDHERCRCVMQPNTQPRLFARFERSNMFRMRLSNRISWAVAIFFCHMIKIHWIKCFGNLNNHRSYKISNLQKIRCEPMWRRCYTWINKFNRSPHETMFKFIQINRRFGIFSSHVMFKTVMKKFVPYCKKNQETDFHLIALA